MATQIKQNATLMQSGKNMVIILILIFLATDNVMAQVSITESKHNLSVLGQGTIKAESEQEICVFCHIPHSGSTVAQLWNKQPTTTESYLLYTSESLTAKGYPGAAQPNGRSRLCLSCHDGTVALGAVFNLPGSGGTQGGVISMTQSGSPITTMPTGAVGHLGTTLTDDHPVGFGFDNAQDPELVVRAWPWGTPVKLDPDASNGKVECQTCHDPHNNQFTKFLRISNDNAGLCIFCHDKTGWNTAIHNTSTQSHTPPGGSATTIGDRACMNCHKPHSSGGVPYILRSPEENTCYTSDCHGTNNGVNTKNIQAQLNKFYRHPTNTENGKHLNPDNSTSLNVPNRHAECMDCHNPHQAKDGLHTLQSNAVSNVLTGAWGVNPESTPLWTQPTSFTVTNPVTQENQICFKCHSYYAYGAATNGVTSIIGPSGTNITDQSMEFNPNNLSAHPVRVTLNNQTGSVGRKRLRNAQMQTGWQTVGDQSMYCSDCHGNDQLTSATEPQGAHGGNEKYMLRGPNNYWPETPGGKLWTLGDVLNDNNNWENDLFCVNCHPLLDGGGDFFNNVHDANKMNRENFTIDGTTYTGIPCVTCHLVVPHGGKRSRLIAYGYDSPDPDVSPRIINTNVALVRGFRKENDYTRYETDNCYSTNPSCHAHDTSIGSYDP